MGIEALKKQLENEEITKEQFSSELKKLLDSEQITQEEHDEAAKAATEGGGNPSNPDGGQGGLTKEEVEEMLEKERQSAADKVRREKSEEMKELQKQLDELKKEKMTDEQKAEYERKQWEQEKAEKERELQKREVALHTVDKLQEKEIPMAFKDILAGDNVEETDKRIDNFYSMWQKEVENKVNERFKEHGDDPAKNRKGGGGNTRENPWKKETFNLTKQAEITKNDPDEAKRLKAEAGH